MNLMLRRRILQQKSFDPLNAPIEFEDQNVKSVLVGLWGGKTGGTASNDTRLNGIKVHGIVGELTYKQAASVIAFGYPFYNNRNIVKFNEFQYFTNIYRTPDVGNQFRYCVNLVELTLPENIGAIWNRFLQQCTSINYIGNYNIVTRVGAYSFYGTKPLNLVFENDMTEIRGHAFQNFNASYIVFKSSIIPTLSPFEGDSFFNSSIKIYVQDSLYNGYLADAKWSAYSSQLKPLSQFPSDFPNETI